MFNIRWCYPSGNSPKLYLLLNRHVSWRFFLSRILFMLIYMHYTKMKLSYNEFIIM